MHRLWRWAVAAAVAVCLTGAIDLTARAAEGKIRVVLIDGQNNHDWRATTPILKKALEDCGRFTVDVSSNLKPGDRPGHVETVPFPPDLGMYDVVLSNYNGAPWPQQFQEALEDYVKNGRGGLVIVHAANNAFGGWTEYNRMIGMGWRDAKFGDRLIVDPVTGQELRVPKGSGPGAGHGAKHPFVVALRDAEHPVTQGMPREWLHASDELYHGMRGPIENVHLLATSFSDKKYGGTGEHEPMIWTVTYGKGRIFHTPMGHDVEAMRCLGFLATVERGTEWAAAGKVTLPLPKNFPTAEKTSSLPAK
jgi:type 1 glutamine amidotransferase